jgi:hypothetical protein
MASQLTNDFKQNFGLLLSIMKINYSSNTALNYSETLIEYTLSGLITEGKINVTYNEAGDPEFKDANAKTQFAKAFTHAFKRYNEALALGEENTSRSREESIKSEILKKCFEINTAIFPIALSEGILSLKDIAKDIMAGQNVINAEVEDR